MTNISIGVKTKRLSSGVMNTDNKISFDNRWEKSSSQKTGLSSCTPTEASFFVGDDDESLDIPSVVEVNDTDRVLMDMIHQLTDHEKETAARSSYAYYKMSTSSETAGCTSTLEEARNQAAMAMAARHLRADDGDAETAMKHFKASIQFRNDKRLDTLRNCFSESTPEALEFRKTVQRFIGEKGKLIIQGFDKDHRACWHTVGRHSPEGTHTDHDGCMISHFYMLERALACSEAHSLKFGPDAQETVIVSVDFHKFNTNHAPPLSSVKELLLGLSHHYPERLFRVYLVDAPLVFRGLWNMIKPFVDPDTKAKFQFVTGASQRTKIFEEAIGSSQCMPYQHPDGKLAGDVNMEDFYKLPLTEPYEGCVNEGAALYHD